MYAALVFLGVVSGSIASGTRRSQFREAGFWAAGRLIPWGKIDAYEISAIGSLSLKRQVKSFEFFCDVPPALRQQAGDLLASKCQALQPRA